MGKTANKGKLHFDMPSPLRGVPWLVYPSQGSSGKQQKFYNIVDGLIEERYNKLLYDSSCRAMAYGWMLIESFKAKSVSLFNPFSSQERPLPKLVNEIPDMIFMVSDPDKGNCFVVGIYEKKHPYFLYTFPRGKCWLKYRLKIECDILILTAASCSGKVYLLTSDYDLLVIQFTPLPLVEKFKTTTRDGNFLPRRYNSIFNLVVSSGALFLVETIAYTKVRPRLFRTMNVTQFDFSTMTWDPAVTLNDSVFVLSGRQSSSFRATNTKLKGNCIYRVSHNVLYCFAMKYRSFTVSYPLSDAAYNECLHFWLLPADESIQMNHGEERNHIREKTSGLTCSYERFIFDSPKFISPSSSSINVRSIQRSKHPRTPWLMFAHRDNGIYKLLDPCTKATCKILLPSLTGLMILASVDGWLFAQVYSYFFVFINPFSKEKIILPNSFHNPVCVALSAPPTSRECKVFFISQSVYGKSTIKISTHQLGERKWTTREFENTANFKLSHSNAVYLNGCFYCLGMNGQLGVYDTTENSWRALCIHVSIEGEAPFNTLVASRGKLLSIFLDLFQRPIGMFEFDLDLWCWKRVADIGDRSFFFSQASSLCVTANNESMKNKIYFPAFEKECSIDLVSYPLSSEATNTISTDISINSKTEYIHVWIQPKI